ncbi:MAG: hypothetical protein GF384_07530 [Elusimicrobia bacterium]|nr:hypothetical protein [Elusimicrobiota bacterium]MBD3412501.1 hypothetical protein [Elusimicrobiota bacterium]
MRTQGNCVNTVIPINQIRDDSSFCISFPSRPSAALKNSIKKISLINPIIVQRNTQGDTYQIITGFKRFYALKALKKKEIPVRIEQSVTPRDALLKNLYENYAFRSFNIIEKAIIIEKLINPGLFKEQEIIKQILPLLDCESNRCEFERIIKLRSLPLQAQRALASGHLSLQGAERMLMFPPAERASLMRLLSILAVGKNKADEIMNLLFDITKREHKGLLTILKSLPVQEIITMPNVPGTEQYHRLRQYLYSRRYPQLYAHESLINQTLQRFSPPSSFSMKPPRQLEGEGLQISCIIRDIEDLRKTIVYLSTISKNKSFKKFLKTL